MVRVLLLVALTILLLHAGVVPYQKMTSTGVPFRDAVHGALKIAWWLWAAWFLVGVLRAFVVTEHRPREGKLVQDLLAGVVYLAAALRHHRLCLRSADPGAAGDLGGDRDHPRPRLAEHVERRIFRHRA